MWPCYGVHTTVCMARHVFVFCQPVHSCIEPSLIHGLDFFLEIFLWIYIIIDLIVATDEIISVTKSCHNHGHACSLIMVIDHGFIGMDKHLERLRHMKNYIYILMDTFSRCLSCHILSWSYDGVCSDTECNNSVGREVSQCVLCS